MKLAHRILRSLGVRVTRNLDSNRFQAMAQALRILAKNGFSPGTIVDAGANVGTWTLMAREIFPSALFEMVEPQSGCAPALQSIAATDGRIRFHGVAVTRPGTRQVSMTGGGPSQSATGAWVLEQASPSPGDHICEATTLDDLFAQTAAEPVLLKLDLEGHEMAALEGAEDLLRRTEVVTTELSLFDVYGSRRPIFSDVLLFLRDRGFELYDVASLSARPRDGRLRQADGVFVRRESPLSSDRSWD